MLRRIPSSTASRSSLNSRILSVVALPSSCVRWMSSNLVTSGSFGFFFRAFLIIFIVLDLLARIGLLRKRAPPPMPMPAMSNAPKSYSPFFMGSSVPIGLKSNARDMRSSASSAPDMPGRAVASAPGRTRRID